MLNFLTMLKGVGSQIGAQGGDRKIGMQYANMGLQAPQLQDPMNMLGGLMSMSGQRGNQMNIPITQLISMMRGG